jgi:hypothetical protein
LTFSPRPIRDAKRLNHLRLKSSTRQPERKWTEKVSALARRGEKYDKQKAPKVLPHPSRRISLWRLRAHKTFLICEAASESSAKFSPRKIKIDLNFIQFNLSERCIYGLAINSESFPENEKLCRKNVTNSRELESFSRLRLSCSGHLKAFLCSIIEKTRAICGDKVFHSCRGRILKVSST